MARGRMEHTHATPDYRSPHAIFAPGSNLPRIPSMSSRSLEDRAQRLRDQLSEHNYRYYVLNDPAVSDREFDALLEDLLTLETEHPELVTPDSPTQRVGSDLTSVFPTVTHARPMLSLANTYTEEEVREFDRRVRDRLKEEPYSY